MDWEEYRKKAPNNEQRLGIMHMQMIANSFEMAVRRTGNRMDGYKYLKRDLAMLRAVMARIIDYSLHDCPDEIIQTITRQSRDYEIALQRKSVTRNKETVMMSIEDLWQIMNIIIESRCALCVNTAQECKNCKLRKLLRCYLEEPEPEYKGGCGFNNSKVACDKQRMNEQVGI